MSNQSEFYQTTDDVYYYDEPKATSKTKVSTAASIAVISAGLGIGIAFNPAAALIGSTDFAESQKPAVIDANQSVIAGSDAIMSDALAAPNSATFDATAVNLAPNTGQYKVPAQQLQNSTGTPNFGSLSSATPSGSVGGSNSRANHDQHESSEHESSSHDREEHGEDQDDD